MSRTTRLWIGAVLLTLAGVLVPGVSTLAGDDPPLSEQMAELGRQALAQGATETAQTFFQKALSLDPSSAIAQRGLKDIERSQTNVTRVAFQDAQPAPAAAGQPATPPPPPAVQPPAPRASIEQAEFAENIARQELTNDVEQRLQAARALLNQGQPEAALSCAAIDPERHPVGEQRRRRRTK